jgi:hypothetical protein
MVEVKFLSVPEFSLVNRRYPIGAVDKTANVKHTVADIKVSEDLDFNIKVPYFANYSSINMVKIGARYYSVLSVVENTRNTSQLMFALRYNPVSSLLTTSSSLNGWFERTPEKVFPAGRIITGSATMKQYEHIPLSNLPEVEINGDMCNPYYVQVTATHSIGGATGYQEVLSVYGYFLEASEYYSSSDIIPEITIYGADNVKYPYFRDIMKDSAAAYKLPANSIIDVSVSKRCPWQFSTNKIYRPVVEKYDLIMGLLKTNGGTVSPPDGATSFIAELTRQQAKPTGRKTCVLTYSDYIRYNAVFNIVTETGEVIGTIPNEYFNTDNTLTIGWEPYADYTGLYTLLDFNGIATAVPEGRMPWTGSAWTDYIARSREYDRQAMEKAIATAKEQLNMDLLNGASNAMLTSAIGVAGGNLSGGVAGLAQFGLSAYSSLRGFDLNKSNLEFEQTLNENRIKAAPMSNYSTSTGMDYFRRSKITGGMGIRIDMPSNLTETQFNEQISYYGWPCNRIATITPKTGFIKGLIYNMDGYGLMGDRLREEVNNGVRMVIV